MMIGVIKESLPGERRVALIPANIPALTKAGLEVMLEPGAGQEAGFPDTAYEEKADESQKTGLKFWDLPMSFYSLMAREPIPRGLNPTWGP